MLSLLSFSFQGIDQPGIRFFRSLGVRAPANPQTRSQSLHAPCNSRSLAHCRCLHGHSEPFSAPAVSALSVSLPTICHSFNHSLALSGFGSFINIISFLVFSETDGQSHHFLGRCPATSRPRPPASAPLPNTPGDRGCNRSGFLSASTIYSFI